jgi:integrase
MKLYKRCDCSETAKCRHKFWYVFKLRGRRYRGSTFTANHQLADRIAHKRRTEALEHREGFRAPKPVKLSEHIKAYVAHTAKANVSSNKDQRVLDALVSSVGDRPISDVSPFHIERWKRTRADAVSLSSVNRELNIVRGCFSRAVEWGRLGLSPVRTVKPYRVDNVRLRVCSEEEIRTILDGLPADLKLLARLTLASLLRLSECLALRCEDIGPTFATVVNSKNGRSRRVPLPPELRVDLLKRCHKSGAVFGVGKAGEPPTQEATSVAFTRALRTLKLSGISHHTFRHTGATVMIANGVSLRAVQTIGGWSSLRMVERYAHVTDEELQRATRIAYSHAEGATNETTAAKSGASPGDAKSDPK